MSDTGTDAWAASIGYNHVESDERIKRLMATTAYPDSMSVYAAMKQLETEVRIQMTEAAQKTAEQYYIGVDVAGTKYHMLFQPIVGQRVFNHIPELPHRHPEILIEFSKH